MLEHIKSEVFPLEADRFGIDSRPNSVFTVTLCFMAEEDTWVTLPITSEILIPWYDCEVSSIYGADKEIDCDIRIWLKDVDYVKKHWKKHVKWLDEE